ncbi:MAG: PPC domain-containing protein [Deltaproteobacteria bacterium]|nr:PPC domain-containing protein [Deltaproteobacteria bacterium]
MKRLSSVFFTSLIAITACTDDGADLYEGESVKSDDDKSDSSFLATFLDAEWDGTLVTDFSFNDKAVIESQLLYTVGQLNGMNSVGRIDKAVVTNIVKSTVNGKTQLKYHAKLLVAYGRKTNIPTSIELKLPLDVSSGGQVAFAEKYGENCVDFSAHDVDSGSMFYYFRPKASGCTIAAADVNTVTATLSPSPVQTTGMFPEYTKIWEDNRLEVVAIFGKNEDGATSGDVGIDAFNKFVGAMKTELSARQLTTIPATVPTNPGVAAPDIELNATLPDGKKIRVVALLTDNIRLGLQQPTFRARYENLSTRADFIIYNGHAGLGVNVRALASAGKWVAGQYVVVQMNGCDTFAYIDDALFRAHKNINPDDTTGFKYIDIINNAMPAFFHDLSNTTMATFRGLLDHAAPKTYEQIFRNIASAQVVLVTGEQDNAFTPGGGGNPTPWAGLTDSGSVAKSVEKRYATPVVAAGTYEFALSGTNDSDLYVRVGTAPTTGTFDCRPYKNGSNEICSVTLAQPSTIHVMVRGYSTAASAFTLTGKKI